MIIYSSIQKTTKLIVFIGIATITGFLAPIVLRHVSLLEAWGGWEWEEHGTERGYTLKPPLSQLNIMEWGIGNAGEDVYTTQGVTINPKDLFELGVSFDINRALLFSVGGPDKSEVIATYELSYDDLGKPTKHVIVLCGNDCNVNRSIYKDLDADGMIDTFSIHSNDLTIHFVLFHDTFVRVTSTRNDLWWIQIDDQEVPVCFDENAWVICEACE